MFDAVSELMRESPDAAKRVRRVQVKRLPEGVLGQIVGHSDTEIDPAQAHYMFEGTPTQQLLEVLRHEAAHLVGYDEDEARTIAGGPGTRRRRMTPDLR